ncbi:MAG TPA: creatininase family protein [Bryobacteraceae bacterium]|nr:creatininase family protein [Bryobacteraceae bacterium]
MITPIHMILAQLSWPEIESVVSRVCVVPLGSLEQHGPHLPLWTDTAIVSEIARRLELQIPEQVVLAPAQPVGHSPHHARFGCLSLDVAAYIFLIENICRSCAAMGFRRIFLLNGHGGNDVPCRAALCQLKCEMPDVRIAFASYWTLASEAFGRIRSSPPGGMNHACEMETSIMLALHPDQVRAEKIKDDGPVTRSGNAQRIPDMLRAQPYYMVRNFDELSGSGTLGCPTQASADKGVLFLDAAVDAARTWVTAFAGGELDFEKPPGGS